MAKQSWKQQMIQQIANKQVQQVMQQKQAEQLQASFKAWQKEQNDIEQIEYDKVERDDLRPRFEQSHEFLFVAVVHVLESEKA